MQAWTEAEKSMSKPSCFLIRSQESCQTGKLEYFVPLQEVSEWEHSDKEAPPAKLEVRSEDSWQVAGCQESEGMCVARLFGEHLDFYTRLLSQ